MQCSVSLARLSSSVDSRCPLCSALSVWPDCPLLLTAGALFGLACAFFWLHSDFSSNLVCSMHAISACCSFCLLTRFSMDTRYHSDTALHLCVFSLHTYVNGSTFQSLQCDLSDVTFSYHRSKCPVRIPTSRLMGVSFLSEAFIGVCYTASGQ